jgi:shikimate kinase
MTARPVVIVGLMGSGKTSVATRVAAALRRPVRDSDEDLGAQYGQTAAMHAARYGADVLHAREARQLRDALAEDLDPPPVIAAAASVVEDETCRRALAAAFVAWLDAPPHVLAERMLDGAHRPRYGPDPEAMLAAQWQRRATLFAEVADVTVDVTHTTPDQAAEAVLRAVRERG